MVVDALAPCVARTSAAMILIMENRQVFVLLEGEFQLPVWRNDIKCKDIFMFSLKNLARKGLTDISYKPASRSAHEYVIISTQNSGT